MGRTRWGARRQVRGARQSARLERRRGGRAAGTERGPNMAVATLLRSQLVLAGLSRFVKAECAAVRGRRASRRLTLRTQSNTGGGTTILLIGKRHLGVRAVGCWRRHVARWPTAIGERRIGGSQIVTRLNALTLRVNRAGGWSTAWSSQAITARRSEATWERYIARRIRVEERRVVADTHITGGDRKSVV